MVVVAAERSVEVEVESVDAVIDDDGGIVVPVALHAVATSTKRAIAGHTRSVTATSLRCPAHTVQNRQHPAGVPWDIVSPAPEADKGRASDSYPKAPPISGNMGGWESGWVGAVRRLLECCVSKRGFR